MKILLATSEAVPYAKTGGLADVCGSLPAALSRLGHQPALIMPAYRAVRYSGVPIEPMGIDFIVPIASKTVTGHLLSSKLPGSDVPVYLIEQDEYFDRDEIYGTSDGDYIDNCERFVFFCRAVMESIRLLELDIDVLHANDWQTGLLPAYLNVEYRSRPRYQKIACLFTIHNMGYQGDFWHWDMLLTGLDWRHFSWREMEYYGRLNLLKTGLAFADAINTVSPRYAQEIQTPQFGYGLDGVLQYRSDVLSGILNGVNGDDWNPATDQVLAANYTADTVGEGKPACKAALQAQLGLPERSDVPLAGMIGRLADQKGFDLMAQVLPEWIEHHDMQWAILGTGEQRYHELLQGLADRCGEKVALRLEFSDELAHRIEAGSDLFVMPSRYEPCGLNQMYSLAYGTVPVVRETGGLADTVVDANPETLAAGTANGFSFTEDNPQALTETLHRARDAYYQGDVWRQLIQTGMKQDWTWSRSAGEYVELYQKTIDRVRQPANV